MTDVQRYLFDTFGYLLLRGVLDGDRIAALRATLRGPTEQTAPLTGDDGPLHWGRAWRDLLDLPALAPVLEELIGNHAARERAGAAGEPELPTYRLDHINVHTHVAAGYPGGILHGGWQGSGGSQFSAYRDGRFYNGLVTVSIELHDTHPNGGGFACVPGSHKANLRFPDAWRDLSRQIPPCVERIGAAAGDALIFTEALTHGSLPWTADAERRTVFYKFSPHATAWSADFFDPGDFRRYPDMDARKLAVLEPPSARYAGRTPKKAALASAPRPKKD